MTLTAATARSCPESPVILRFETAPEAIRIAVMLHVRFPLSLRNVEELLHERGIGDLPQDFSCICYPRQLIQTVPFSKP